MSYILTLSTKAADEPDTVQERLGAEEAAIFDAHLLMLEDEALLAGAYQRIEQELMNAERALWEAAEELAQIISALNDSYFQARAADVYDIRMRIICHLQGRPVANLRHLQQPVIVAHTIARQLSSVVKTSI